MSERHHDEEEGSEPALSSLNLTWQNGFQLDGKPFVPHIFDGPLKSLPDGEFNTLLIPLQAGLQSDLNWQEAQELAAQAVEKGLYILWELELGLAEGSIDTAKDKSCYLSFQIALEHFCNTLWKEFALHTVGAVLYRGAVDFERLYQADFLQHPHYNEWLKEMQASHSENLQSLYCRDLFAEYITLLAADLPAELHLFLMLDCSGLTRAACLQRISQERFSRFHLILKGACEGYPSLSWEENRSSLGVLAKTAQKLPSLQPIATGILVPSADLYDPTPFEEIANRMASLPQPVRLIPEPLLIEQWDGLDQLYVNTNYLTTKGKRMILGFSAAGGQVAEVEER